MEVSDWILGSISPYVNQNDEYGQNCHFKAITLWVIWHYRNLKIFKITAHCPEQAIAFVRRICEDHLNLKSISLIPQYISDGHQFSNLTTHPNVDIQIKFWKNKTKGPNLQTIYILLVFFYSDLSSTALEAFASVTHAILQWLYKEESCTAATNVVIQLNSARIITWITSGKVLPHYTTVFQDNFFKPESTLSSCKESVCKEKEHGGPSSGTFPPMVIWDM